MIDFNQITRINSLLKENGYEYSIHAIGGCSCAGVKLVQKGKSADLNEIVALINDYLSSSWQLVTPSEEDDHYLIVKHKMDLL